jgi:hypothetical protein
MKFILGAIPEDPTFDPEQTGWRSLREPDPVMLNLIALPVAGVLFGALVLAINLLTPVSISDATRRFIPAFLIIIPLHELVHALFTPRFGATSQTLLGCWPARILFYAFYTGELPARQFLTVLLAPFVVITVIPLAVISLLSLNSPWTAAMALANGIGASGDLVGVFVVLTQIPRGAIVRNKGWRSYWKPGEPG